jgi:hypothetical protein
MKFIQKLQQWLLSLKEIQHPYAHLNDWRHGLGFDDYGNPVYLGRQRRKVKKRALA